MTGNFDNLLFRIFMKSLDVFDATQFPPRSYFLIYSLELSLGFSMILVFNEGIKGIGYFSSTSMFLLK
jgi:hypothetical protein